MSAPPLLSIRDLTIAFGAHDAARKLSFDIAPGETLALVGESGSGKSVTALSVLKLLPPSARITGQILFKGQDLLTASPPDLRAVRGNDISMIFQEPMSSLNPVHTVEKQIGEVLAIHRGMRATAARARTLELLDAVGIADPASRL
ncbi:MAG TPA: ATP-binding cassette domain-containing protein, partial [Devosia sp.]|nr:ATP-binding cassette domain-containing protein [Devosia sp.]